MKKFVLIFVTAVAVASVSVFAAYNLPENTDASKLRKHAYYGVNCY